MSRGVFKFQHEKLTDLNKCLQVHARAHTHTVMILVLAGNSIKITWKFYLLNSNSLYSKKLECQNEEEV